MYGPQQQSTATDLISFAALLFLSSNFIGAVQSTPVIDGNDEPIMDSLVMHAPC